MFSVVVLFEIEDSYHVLGTVCFSKRADVMLFLLVKSFGGGWESNSTREHLDIENVRFSEF